MFVLTLMHVGNAGLHGGLELALEIFERVDPCAASAEGDHHLVVVGVGERGADDALTTLGRASGSPATLPIARCSSRRR